MTSYQRKVIVRVQYDWVDSEVGHSSARESDTCCHGSLLNFNRACLKNYMHLVFMYARTCMYKTTGMLFLATQTTVATVASLLFFIVGSVDSQSLPVFVSTWEWGENCSRTGAFLVTRHN